MPGSSGTLTRMRTHLRNRLVSGMLLLVPLGVTLLVMKWLFNWLGSFLKQPVSEALAWLSKHSVVSAIPETYVDVLVSTISIILLLVLLYLVGAVGHFVLGRRVISLGEAILLRIPLVGTVYKATKQVVEAISLPDRAAFKSVVLVEFPRPGFQALGFLTGYLTDAAGRQFCKVFIPTTPNPTTGFFEIVPAEEVVETAIPTEDAFKMIISGGIISPDQLGPLGKPKGSAPPAGPAGTDRPAEDA